MKSHGKLAAGLIASWFIVVLSASALHLFRNDPNRVGVAVALAALAPVALFSVWFAASEKFQQFALSLNPRTLTAVQSWRIFGFLFLLLSANAILPPVFAVPAAFVAWKLASPAHRTLFVLWQGLGMTDLLMAIVLGTTARLLSPNSPSMSAMTELPLSLIPTFFVPLLLILHVVCIAQARQWQTQRHGRFEKHLAASQA